MTRNTHHRSRDHFGTDDTTNILLDGAIGGIPDNTSLHDVLESVVYAGLSICMEGNNNAVSAGLKGFLEIPFTGTIVSARLFADLTTSAVVDIWKVPYSGFPGDSGDSICSSNKPTISTAYRSDSSLSGWTTAVSVGDILMIHIDSNSFATLLTLALRFSRSA